MRPGNAADAWSAVLLALAGAGIAAEAWRWDYMTPEGPGAGFLPLWIGIAMVALSLALLAVTLRGRLAGATTIRWSNVRRPLAAWGALAVVIAAMDVLGFVAAYFLLCFFLVAFVHRRSWATAAIVAAAAAASFHLVFDVALGVSLPRGLLF